MNDFQLANTFEIIGTTMSISTPVTFFIFNRPDLTKIVFQAIAQAKPKKLLVVADGPRFPEEVEKCEETRAVIERVDWNCEVITNFSDKNLGCSKRVSSGIDWVFSQFEEAIFLEDDILPTQSFFYFCQLLLARYRDDERIMHISGDNSLNQKRNSYSYFFSKYVDVWGWASWRRAWQHYDYNMKTWPEFKRAGLLKLVCDESYELNYWTSIFDKMYEDPLLINTWDFQWLYACWFQNGLAIEPNTNLTSNLGFDRADATHTSAKTPFSKLPTTDIWDVSHPPFVVQDRQADNNTFDCFFGGKYMRYQDHMLGRVRLRLSSAKRKVISWLASDLLSL